MKKTSLRCLIASVLLFISAPTYATNSEPRSVSVHLYNWWDYIAPATTKRLSNSGYQTKLTIYKSNEVALSRLSAQRHSFDVAIVSNFALPYLMAQGLIETNQFQDAAQKRGYLPLFNDTAQHCLPYLWSSTVFVANQKEKAPDSLADLVALKRQGYKIGIVDDLYETSARLIGDSRSVCGRSPDNYIDKNIFDVLADCPSGQFIESKGLESGDFVSSIADLLAHPKMAVYGWHGEALSNISKYPSLKISIPKTRPTIGYDAVCITKRKDRQIPLSALVRFVEILTDKKSTELNMNANQYFSPYRNHTTGLMPQTQKLYSDVTDNLEHTKPILIKPPTLPVHTRLNEWWKSVRYGP